LEPGQPTFQLLVVEDMETNQRLLVELLQPLGFDIRVAGDGQEAITLWKTWHPDVILMDMRMPVMDGFTATREIRSASHITLNSCVDCRSV
jgi:CheY-like chemotaxis protein